MACAKVARFCFLLSTLLFPVAGHAQDIHFSQFYNAAANLNPALTGVFAADLRFTANYRSQWKSVPVNYRTFSGAFDSKLYHKALGKSGYLGYGLLFNNDVAGDANIGISELGGNLAYVRQLGESFFASIGLQLRLGQRSISPQNLTYESQWNGDLFNPNQSNGESFGTTSKGIFSISTGLNFHYQMEDKRTKLDFGAGFFHLNQPNTSFQNEPSAQLPLKVNPYLLTTFEVAPKFDVRVNCQFAKQLTYTEIVAMAAVRYHFSTEKYNELNFQLGAGTRINDALFAAVEAQYRNWNAGFSYDLNTSPFKVATYRRGGPELFLQYLIWRVKAPKEYKSCPIF